MPRIVFIEPQAPNLHIFSQFPLPRLGTLILGTIMKRRGWEVEVFVEDLRRIDYDLLAASDIVGISTITSTAPRAYAIADKVRAMGLPVLMGGPHVTYLTEEALGHAVELLVAFNAVKRYPGPLIDSIGLTLLFGLLHWLPLRKRS